MERFTYLAYNKEGLRVEGVAAASTAESARDTLVREGLIPVRIDRAEAKKNFLRDLRLKKRVSAADLEFFSSEISILLRNGIKIDRALDIVRKGITEAGLKQVLESTYSEVRRGTPLSEALANQNGVFDPLYVSIVAIGERTGKLAEAFADLEKNLKFRQQIVSRMRQASAYPAFILVFCVLALLFIFNFIIPRFAVLFEGVSEVPVYTQLLLDSSAFLRAYQLPAIICLAGIAALLWRLLRTSRFRNVLDALMLKIPGFRSLVLIHANLRFASALKILLNNNVAINDALEYAVSTVGNSRIRRSIRFLHEDIKRGKELSTILSKARFFPPSFISLIEVGEHSGKLSEIFEELEARFRIRFEERMMQLATFIEPVLILVMGVIVGAIVVMLLLSIVSLQNVQGLG